MKTAGRPQKTRFFSLKFSKVPLPCDSGLLRFHRRFSSQRPRDLLEICGCHVARKEQQVLQEEVLSSLAFGVSPPI